MAATYPLEVVEAARWTQANPNLKGDAAVAGGQGQGLGRQREVAGRLPADPGDDEQQPRLDPEARRRDDRPAEGRGRFHPAPARQGGGGRQPQDDAAAEGHDADGGLGSSAIVIEPANPELIYVPYYNPTWAYGPWPYPAYPPVYYPPPPNYGAALATGMMFGLGVAAGAAMFGGWHWGWSGGGWGASYTTVNVNRATTISANNFDANRYRDGQWQHDAAHRDGVPYRTSAERERYNQTRPGAQQREQFRGQLDGRDAGGQRASRRRPTATGSRPATQAASGGPRQREPLERLRRRRSRRAGQSRLRSRPLVVGRPQLRPWRWRLRAAAAVVSWRRPAMSGRCSGAACWPSPCSWASPPAPCAAGRPASRPSCKASRPPTRRPRRSPTRCARTTRRRSRRCGAPTGATSCLAPTTTCSAGATAFLKAWDESHKIVMSGDAKAHDRGRQGRLDAADPARQGRRGVALRRRRRPEGDGVPPHRP